MTVLSSGEYQNALNVPLGLENWNSDALLTLTLTLAWTNEVASAVARMATLDGDGIVNATGDVQILLRKKFVALPPTFFCVKNKKGERWMELKRKQERKRGFVCHNLFRSDCFSDLEGRRSTFQLFKMPAKRNTLL